MAGVISVNLSPVVPQPGGETRFILARNNSDLSAIANTLAGISEPLAIELKTYNARDPVSSKRGFKDVALLSIKASGLPPWLIDLKETGYDLGELKDVLQNHEVIAHDAAFVVGFLRTNLELHLKRVWCTLTAVKLAKHQLDVDFSYDLGPVLEKYLSVTIPEDPGTTDWGKPLTEDQYRYAAATVEYLHPLKATLEQALIQSHVLPAFQALNAMIPISPFTYEQQLRAVVPPPMTSFIRSTEATNKDDNGHVPSGDHQRDTR